MTNQIWQVEVLNSIKGGAKTVSEIVVDIALPGDWVRPAIQALIIKNLIVGSDGSYEAK